jgi:hypothetical protein
MQRPTDNNREDEKENEQNHSLEYPFACELKFRRTAVT